MTKQKESGLKELTSTNQIKKLGLEQVGPPYSDLLNVGCNYDRSPTLHANETLISRNNRGKYEGATHFMRDEKRGSEYVAIALVFYKPSKKQFPLHADRRPFPRTIVMT